VKNDRPPERRYVFDPTREHDGVVSADEDRRASRRASQRGEPQRGRRASEAPPPARHARTSAPTFLPRPAASQPRKASPAPRSPTPRPDPQTAMPAPERHASSYHPPEPAAQHVHESPRQGRAYGPTPDGRVYAVFGCKGGAGATTVAVNLVARLAQGLPFGAAIVDLDLQLGDVMCAMNLEPVTSLADLAAEIGTLDTPALKRRLAPHGTGAYALSQVGRLDQLAGLRPEALVPVLSGLRQHFDAVVLDGLRDFGDVSLAALDLADRIVMVVTEDVPSARGAARCMEIFRQLGYPDERVALVVNRHRNRAAVQPQAIAEALNLPLTAAIENDFQVVEKAVNDGVTLEMVAPRAKVTRDIAMLAAHLHGAVPVPLEAGDADPNKNGLLGRLFGMRPAEVKR
jgi:pilus assembly protein CpaE